MLDSGPCGGSSKKQWYGYSSETLNSCYTLSFSSSTWEASNETCSQNGGYLLSLESMAEGEFAKNFTLSLDVWLGLKRRPGSPDVWESGVDLSSSGYSDWGTNGLSGVNCTALALRGGQTKMWFDYDCRTSLPAVCEKSKAKVCLQKINLNWGKRCEILPGHCILPECYACNSHMFI